MPNFFDRNTHFQFKPELIYLLAKFMACKNNFIICFNISIIIYFYYLCIFILNLVPHKCSFFWEEGDEGSEN
jgi:hypothetical protein